MKNVKLILAFCSVLFLLSCGDDEPEVISGCTNANADNYNPNANSDDGSCIISGCTDPMADNYNPEANNDDGSCVYPRDKWLGIWDIELDCNNQLIQTALAGQEFQVEIVPSESDVNFVQIKLVNSILQGEPEDIEINGNVIEYNPPKLSIPFNGDEFETEVGITLILQSDEVTMGGSMDITIFDVPFVGTITDVCDISGTKQE